MIGLRVSVPIASFRKGAAREFLDSEPLPPPATCYGFLLALVGEWDRYRHIGVRVTPALLSEPAQSTVLRTMWRVKKKDQALGAGSNMSPDYQVLLTGVELAIWCDSSEETGKKPALERRLTGALEHPERIRRSGGLSIGESTHLVDDVRILGSETVEARTFLLAERGRLALPTWVDHVGSKGTRYARGDLVTAPLASPPLELMPKIESPPVPKKNSKTKHKGR